MKRLSADEHRLIVAKLSAGYSVKKVASSTHHSPSTISRIRSKECPDLEKLPAGRPSKLNPTNIRHAVHLITSQKAENAVQVSRALQNITNQPISAQTVRRHLRKAGMKAVVKEKKPLLSKRHRKARLDFAL